MSDSVRPHRRQPNRLPSPWDSPAKNAGVGCHFLLQCMKVKSESEVPQSCPTQRPHGLQPTRLLHPWDLPGKSTGVGCHCLLHQSLSHVQLFVTLWTAAHQASQFPEITQTHVHQISDAIQPSHSLGIPLPPSSIIPSIRVFSGESVLRIRWPKYWSFSFNISPSKEYSGLISFRMGWLDLPEVQGTFKSLLQHHNSKASILWHSAFFIVQLSHPYMTTRKTRALIRWTFASQVMSLLFNMLSRLIIAFLPRSKCLLISWLQTPSAVTLEPPKIVCHCFHHFPIYLL